MPTLGFNANRLKVHLRLSINRLKLLQQKKTTANKVVRKELASLLEQGKDESARIRVEHVIREDFNMEAMEVLELYCELLLARFGLIESMSACDSAISEAVNTLIYAAPRSEVKELHMVRDQLISKYGRDFAAAAMENRNEVVNPRVIQKLKIQTPDPFLVNQYLKEIAKTYNVKWDGDVEGMDSMLGIGPSSQKDTNVRMDPAGNLYYDATPPVPANLVPHKRTPSNRPVSPAQYSPYQQQTPPENSNELFNLPPDAPAPGSMKMPEPNFGDQQTTTPPTGLGYSNQMFDFQKSTGNSPAGGNVPSVMMPKFEPYRPPVFAVEPETQSGKASPPAPDFPAIPQSLPKDEDEDGSNNDGKGHDEDSFDELAKRFEALKKNVKRK